MGQRKRAVLSLSPAEAERILWDWEFWARDKQLEPPGDWFTWLIHAGRGFGKTRTGAETVRKWAWEKRFKQILIGGRTAGDVRSIMIEGPSGILATSPPWFTPIYEPSKRQLTWPNGVVGVIRYGDAPEGFRGFEGGGAWLDELFHWAQADSAFDNLMFGMRERGDIRVMITCTPLPTRLCREISKEDDTEVTHGSTFENEANLAPKALAKLKKKYAGTRVGRQELDGEILTDNPAAQWTYELITRLRRGSGDVPTLVRVVIAVDPAASHGPKSDETGIVVAGLGVDGHVYVLDDLSLRGKPGEWARVVAGAYARWGANLVVAEKNNGGDMVESTLRSANAHLPVRLIHAKKGKRTRAEPVAVLYEQGLVHHVWDADDSISPAANGELYPFSEMERQMVSVDVNDPKDHDDRLDANVYAVTELLVDENDPLGDLEAMA